MPHMGAISLRTYAYIVVILFQIAIGRVMATPTAGPVRTSIATLIRVDQSGNGDFKTIQEAIDSVPSNNSELVFILVKPGIYREKVVVPADKPFITLSGTRAEDTLITGSDSGNIFESPTMTVLASDFVGRYLTIENTYGSGDKAVALRVSGDRAAFYGCRILSYQDTLLDDTGSHYYSNCYIEGATDFICGNAASLFERCHLHSISKNNGSITAQHRNSPSENTGFLFLGCKITGDVGGSAFLGRPWGVSSRVVFAYSYMSGVINPPGWSDWNDKSKGSGVFYAEYRCYGPGADRAHRVGWSQTLSNEEAEPLLTKEMIGGRSWLRPPPRYFKRGSKIIRAGGNM
ncbi:putative pectinesterase 11 [Turnera subulata]|uniref:pectinesterase n=1 Tax=Turnera subulata TaxID=218843 RepID=A0A9Q0FX30_9ROSI|nr:putative pectinesterase 11 [Turnera subulata]